MGDAATWNLYARQCRNGLAAVDAQRRLVFANPAFCSYALQSDGVREGRPLSEQPLDHALLDGLVAGLDSFGENGAEFVWEHGAGGDSRSCLCRILPPPNGDGHAVIEITKLPDEERARRILAAERTAMEHIEAQKERGRRLILDIIEELPVFVYMQRRDYNVAYANRKTRNLYGEPNGRLCYEMFSGRDSPCPFCPTFKVFETNKPEEWQFTDLEGRSFHIYDYPFEDEHGEPLVMELGMDITELKRVEQELVQAQKMRAIGVLAGGIAHDLNNNLLPIIFNIDYELSKAPEGQASEALTEALKAAYRAADLVEQVLDYSRQQNFSRSPLQLIPLATEYLELFQPSLPSSVRLSMDFSARQDCIVGNPSQVQQLLLNLCRNAVQAMPDGGDLDISIRNLRVDSLKHTPHPGLSLGEYVVLTVRDTGHGMEADRIERIFEPFYTSKKGSGGTGMGLAVVHAIVSSSRGVIHVNSTPGEGTEFTVYIPVAQERKPPVVAEPNDSGATRGRLLIVDDDSRALQAMARTLGNAGLEVFTAESGEEGLERFINARHRFSLVLADHTMPGMTGVDMASRILAHDQDANVIICTGHVEPELEEQALAAGIREFIMKPMTPRALVETVKKYCSHAAQ